MAWIRLFDFDVKHIPGRLNGGPDALSRRPPGEGENEAEGEDELEETIEASLRGIQAEPPAQTALAAGPGAPRGGRWTGRAVGPLTE